MQKMLIMMLVLVVLGGLATWVSTAPLWGTGDWFQDMLALYSEKFECCDAGLMCYHGETCMRIGDHCRCEKTGQVIA